ncbi:MAG: exodeoxyribonuclease VII large subunit [Gemmatimonadales bacterium]|nr:exodeoxyribonuclease VII large subunit [Gemmatimonadales bacterium]
MTLTLPLTTPGPTDDVWTVGDLTGAVKRLVEGEFPPVWVRGEVTQCRAWPSGHWYFTLRDGMCQVRCCMWKQTAMRAGKPPADGTEVFVLAKPGIYESKGEFQLIVSRFLPTAAIGAAQRELERVRALLQQDGLFELTRKRAIPDLVCTIAVVTSTAGAALRDIITVVGRRWPCATLLVVDARVQGDGAAADLVRALRVVNRLAGVELCIIGRGGGAREDLAAFNDESVCRALAALRVPTISAVGHETDVSLTDLIADLRAATPSAAAEAAVADIEAILHRIDGVGRRLAHGLSGRTRVAAERLERTADRLHCAIGGTITGPRHRLDRLTAQLDALSPLRVLGRGYAMPTAEPGRVLKRAAEFTAGLRFDLRVSDGQVKARVE